MEVGTITKALSGFYYVESGSGELFECRARGRFRLDGLSPLVGDIVDFSPEPNHKGTVVNVHTRKNSFVRPAVANIDCMVVLCCNVNPITDPFLADRVTALCETVGCEVVVCINKADLDPGDRLYDIYSTTGYKVIRTSAVTGQGLEELMSAMSGRLCAFTGNSGAGKSSILNALDPELHIKVGEVSEKLGRGRHTTRHVEIFTMAGGARIVDTPGFSSFDMERTEYIPKDRLQYAFPEFSPFLGHCRFQDCAHLKEPGCAVTHAVEERIISPVRYDSYARLYGIAAQKNEWELK